MTNIYTLKHPLKPGFEPVILLIADVAKELACDFFIVGATARDLLLFHVLGRDPGRQTRDIDTGILVSDWDEYARVKNALIKRGLSETKQAHRLRDDVSGLPVDIIPFGEIADQDGSISWPPEHTSTMSVAGFKEAYQASLAVDLGKNTVVHVASLAGLALLKLIAWKERGTTNNKDAEDLLNIMLQYQHVQADRLWEEFIPAEALNFDIERQAAFLLGYDMNGILKNHAENDKAISGLKFIADTQQEKLITSVLKAQSGLSDDKVEQLIEDFWLGVEPYSL